MMMLPAAAFGDIMMTNVMNPIMDMFTGTRHKGSTERKEETERSSKEKTTRSISRISWRVSPPQKSRRPRSRRDWWRSLGQVDNKVDNKVDDKVDKVDNKVGLISHVLAR